MGLYTWCWQPDVWWAMDVFFSVIFMVELAIKLAVLQVDFWSGPTAGWNLFDFLLVAMALVDMILNSTEQSAASASLSTFTVLRVVRVVRVVRIARVLKVFQELYILLSGMFQVRPCWVLFHAARLLTSYHHSHQNVFNRPPESWHGSLCSSSSCSTSSRFSVETRSISVMTRFDFEETHYQQYQSRYFGSIGRSMFTLVHALLLIEFLVLVRCSRVSRSPSCCCCSASYALSGSSMSLLVQLWNPPCMSEQLKTDH